MELLVKLYSNKPSKIAVKFTHEYQAIKAYEAIISKYRGETFHLKIEPVKDKLHLQLVSEESGARIPYKDIEFRIDQLNKLKAFPISKDQMQFVHVFSRNNSLFIAKPFRSAEFISVSEIEIVSPGNFGNVV